MTDQEAFDKVWEHFTRTGAERSATDDGDCVYRLDGDPKSPVRCGVGVLIKDENYKPEFEGCAIDTLIDDYHLGCRGALPELNGLDISLLVAIQKAHDEAYEIEGVLNGLRDVAERFALEVPA